MKQVEAAVQGSSHGISYNGSEQTSPLEEQSSSGDGLRPLFTDGVAAPRLSPDEHHTHTNGSVATGTGQYVNYDAYSDESDAEAAAGIAMMRMAEEEEKAEAQRRRSRGDTMSSLFPPYASPTNPAFQTSQQESTSDSDYAHHDLALYGGGYEGQMHYGESPVLDSAAAQEYRGGFNDDTTTAFHFTTPARVDTGGTGGLSEPSAMGRRMSFDYGDEDADPVLTMPDGDIPSGSQSPEKGEPADLFYHPGMRPLPPAPVEPANNAIVLPHLIPAGTYRTTQYDEQEDHDQYRPLPQPISPNSTGLSLPNPSQVPRSTSMSSHSNTPRTDAPIRSKTDADRVKYKQQAKD